MKYKSKSLVMLGALLESGRAFRVLDGLDVDSSDKQEDSANWGKDGLPARNMN